MIAPEDLVPVPGTDWVVASGYTAGGAIHLINTKDYTSSTSAIGSRHPPPT